MKLDFTKADDIVEVTQTCPECKGAGIYYDVTHRNYFSCTECSGRGKIVTYMTPKAIREMIKEEGEPK